MIWNLREIYSGWSNQGAWDRRDFWQSCWKREIH